MNAQPINLSLALVGGISLASMIAINSELASFSSPLLAAWFAHGIGSVTSFIILVAISSVVKRKKLVLMKDGTPIWAYLGGIPGAFTVILAAITVNSSLGLSGSVALIMAGQILFGLVSDTFGLFKLPKRSLNVNHAISLSLMIIGCLTLLFSRS